MSSNKKYRLGGYLILACIMASFPVRAQHSPGQPAQTGYEIMLHGVRHHYEVTGSGKPLLLIHGNSTGISGWTPQIAYFARKYTVYAIDCRGRGRSDLGNDTLSYALQANDMADFIQQLQLDSVSVVGKSDGAIIALLLGIYHPQHIARIVAFSANLQPDSAALYGATVREIHKERIHAEHMLAQKDTTADWELVRQRNRMMEFQPHITAAELQQIPVPVLVLSCDRDVIREEHTLFIYKNIPRAHLCILPGETHHVARENAGLFNAMVDKFLSGPYKDNSSRF